MASLLNSLMERDRAHTLHPYANHHHIAEHGSLIVSRGDGMKIFDDQGRGYIESVAGLWSASLGFGGEPRLVDAAARAMERLPFYHQFGPKAHEPGILLAERLIEMAPAPMSKVFFACSGSEANDTAAKLVWYYNNVRGRPRKKKIISRMRGYHGVTIGSASLTGIPHNHALFDLPIPNVLHTHCPHYYRGAEEGETEAEFVTRITDDLERMILDEGPETVAAFIAEPINGAGGVVVPPQGYFARVQEILQKYDVLFIVDEVICGFGRTGKAWGSLTFDLRPDILTCAKMLTASYLPLSAVMVRDEIYAELAKGSAEIGTFGHGFTYGGHPVSSAVALECLDIYEERGIYAQVAQTGAYMQAALGRFSEHPLVGEVRGIGLVAGLELVADKPSKRPLEKALGVAPHFIARCQEHGMISRAVGDTICVSPPLIATEPDIDAIVSILGVALDDTYDDYKDRL